MSSEPGQPGRDGWPRYYTVVLLLFAAVFISYLDRTNISVAAIAMKDELGWTETDKGLVLSSFFIGYLLLMAVSGALANRYGGWLVLGIAVLWWSIWTMLTPPAAMVSLAALLAARIALGLGEAAVFPASINMIGRWVPLERRSRATALLVSAISLGTVFSLPVTGWLVRDYGWHLPFYLFGALGVVWCVAWFALARNGRADVEAPAQERADERRAIPWGRLLATPAVWAIIVAHFSNNWALYLTIAWLPSYFKTTFGVSLANAGLLSAAPWLVSFICANLAGAWADRMLKAGRSAGFVRRLMQTIALVGGAVFLLLLTRAPTATVAVVLLCFSTGAYAFCMSGFAPNCFDIAPKHADVIWGISNTAATLPGVVGVYITGWLVDRTGTFVAPFLLTAGISLFGAVFYLVFASGERQVD
ncbi:MAG: ACS family MFS transporter [Gammaproteobacteria bacterium]|nr:ACS family MFS transporter [Gammaproteobacteria bacterium]